MTAAIYAEEWWEGRGKPETDDGPHCPHCKYDVRATPFRCPECGLILKPNYDQNGLHIAPGHAMTQRL
jgi:predicted amidophosphoribosyltransferase